MPKPPELGARAFGSKDSRSPLTRQEGHTGPKGRALPAGDPDQQGPPKPGMSQQGQARSASSPPRCLPGLKLLPAPPPRELCSQQGGLAFGDSTLLLETPPAEDGNPQGQR